MCVCVSVSLSPNFFFFHPQTPMKIGIIHFILYSFVRLTLFASCTLYRVLARCYMVLIKLSHWTTHTRAHEHIHTHRHTHQQQNNFYNVRRFWLVWWLLLLSLCVYLDVCACVCAWVEYLHLWVLLFSLFSVYLFLFGTHFKSIFSTTAAAATKTYRQTKRDIAICWWYKCNHAHNQSIKHKYS